MPTFVQYKIETYSDLQRIHVFCSPEMDYKRQLGHRIYSRSEFRALLSMHRGPFKIDCTAPVDECSGEKSLSRAQRQAEAISPGEEFKFHPPDLHEKNG